MALLADQIDRLLREKWKDPYALAMELYAILSSDSPIQITSPVQVQTDAPGPAFTINLGSDQGTPLQVRHGDDAAQMNLTPDGGITFDNVSDPTPSTPTFADPANPDPALSKGTNNVFNLAGGGSGGGGLFGTVVGGGPGPGPYQVDVLLAGGGTQRVDVTQYLIDAAATVPAGWPVVVVKVGTSYYMQAPVWMA